VQAFGGDRWNAELKDYLAKNVSLADKYARDREQTKIPVTIDGELVLKLSSGVHSILIKEIIEEFGPRFVPASKLIYVGDTGTKFGFFDEKMLSELGVNLDNHGKMPDVVLYSEDKNWLLLIESVTSHGPVDGKRYGELEELFKEAKPELVYVTALPSRSLLARFLPVIAWETEVWVSDAPSHLIHFNGDKFLGPYKK
jgi:type II restriction enzyme